MAEIKKIIFICVNFNNFLYTEKFCSSLAKQFGKDYDFMIDCIIVDNSIDHEDAGLFEKLGKDYTWIRYFRAPENLGYFGGLNYGLKYAALNTCSYVVICNNDLYFEPEFCWKLCSANYGESVYAVCPNVITKDGVHQNPHVMKRMGWWRRFQLDVYFSHYYIARLLLFILRIIRPEKLSPPQPASACEIHMGIGACYILTLAFLRKFRYLHYSHFLYGEEAYFSDQIHSANGILWFDPSLRVDHEESATLSKIPKRTTYEFSKAGYFDYRKML
ncbi:MAG: glycosyltransferase [Rhodoferax sp.]|nr:glycosyltransferase [Rhodoferax sp.]